MEKTKEFATLDREIAASLTKLAHFELGRQSTRRNDEALNTECRVARVRELLSIVFRHYAAGRSAEVLFNLTDRQKVALRGDNIEEFHNPWVMVLSGLSKVPDPDRF